MDADRTKVGLIGIGAMGMPIAERLLGAGHPLTVYDVRPKAMAPLKGRADLASSPADLADRAAIVIGCLSTLDTYRDAITGQGGVIEGKAVRIYVHFGTTGGAFLRELAEPLKARGIETLDAPVTGGVPRARKGELTVIVSGPKTAAAEAEPVFRSYGRTIIRVGEMLGQAQTIKLINNMLSAGSLAMACEALTMGMKAGIAPEQILEVVNNGTGQSNATLTKLPQYVVPRTFDYGGSLKITLKDTAAYADEAADLGVSSTIASAVRQTYLDAAQNGHAEADMTAIALHFEALAGMTDPSR